MNLRDLVKKAADAVASPKTIQGDLYRFDTSNPYAWFSTRSAAREVEAGTGIYGLFKADDAGILAGQDVLGQGRQWGPVIYTPISEERFKGHEAATAALKAYDLKHAPQKQAVSDEPAPAAK